MAKQSQLLSSIRENIKKYDNTGIIYQAIEEDDSRIREFLHIFSDVSDTRMPNKCTYDTSAIAGIVFLGLLCNMDTWTEIAMFARKKKAFLSQYIDFPDGKTPSHDTLARVFSLISSETLENALVSFIQESIEKTAEMLEADDSEGSRILAIDGKELKGSGRKYGTSEKIRNSQIMNFYEVTSGVCIRTQLIDSKTNEIPTAQKVLSELNIKGMIVTSDAMNCQKETVRVITEGKGHYVIGLKGNHGDFHSEVEQLFEKNAKKKYSEKNYWRMDTEKNHNQVEIREFYKLPASRLVFSEGWEKLKNVVVYRKTVTDVFTDETKVEKRYYITDLNDIELIAISVRRHWGVENELHWHLDVSLSEDANRTVNRNAANNLSVMKKNLLTMLKLMQPLFGNASVKATRKLFAIDYEKNVMLLLGLLDGKNIEKLIKAEKQA